MLHDHLWRHISLGSCLSTPALLRTTDQLFRLPAVSQGQEQQQQMGGNEYQDLFVSDFMLRLNMLQARYPSYIDPSMVDDWSTDVQEVRRVLLPLQLIFACPSAGAALSLRLC